MVVPPYATDTSIGRSIEKGVIRMPKEYEDKKIPTNLSVKDLLGRISFVTQGDPKQLDDWQSLFSQEPPNTGLGQLFQLCILPPEGVLEKMLKKYTEISARSVFDWSYKKSGIEVRYPLHVLAIYREFGRANKTRLLWRSAEDWMARWEVRGLGSAAQLADRLMCTLEWDTYIRASGTNVPTNALLSMLDDAWMSDNQLDMILQVLTERLRNTPEHHKAIIAPCIFFQHINNVYSSRNKGRRLTVPLLERYRTMFSSGLIQVLYFISLVDDNHFVAWRIDYQEATLCHGAFFPLHPHGRAASLSGDSYRGLTRCW